LVLTAALVFAAACGSDDDDSSDASTSTRGSSSASTSSSTTSTSAPCPPLANGTTAPSDSTATGSAALTGVGVTSGDCTDVVTFTFSATAPDAPGYHIEYRNGPFNKDPSDEPVSVAGTAFLAVRFAPAYGYDVNTMQPTYNGPQRLDATGAFFVKDVVEIGDFEGVLNWVIGVDQQRPYLVTVTGSTTRTVTIELR
jgi:hypothetical protein